MEGWEEESQRVSDGLYTTTIANSHLSEQSGLWQQTGWRKKEEAAAQDVGNADRQGGGVSE